MNKSRVFQIKIQLRIKLKLIKPIFVCIENNILLNSAYDNVIVHWIRDFILQICFGRYMKS